jgi:uncharacterized cupin superfamily protein
MTNKKPINAKEIKEQPKKSLYPAPFAALMNKRVKRKLGDHFGLTNFGVNLTELSPGGISALKHHHQTQDEFIYVLSGTPTLIFGDEEHLLGPGDCFGFCKGSGIGHQLINKSDKMVSYLEIGDRTQGDAADYPDDDLQARVSEDGSWVFLHKDGSEY